jgi:hypothetical protein
MKTYRAGGTCGLAAWLVAAAAAASGNGCAARGAADCNGSPCEPNPADFRLEVIPPQGVDIPPQQWSLGPASADGVRVFDAVLVAPVLLQGAVLQNVAGGAPQTLQGAVVAATRVDGITGENAIVTDQTDDMGRFELKLLPGIPVKLTITLPALGLPPIVLEGSPEELAALPASAYTFLAAEEYYRIDGTVLLQDAANPTMLLPTPVPNLRVRVYDVTDGTVRAVGVSTITDCGGQFSVLVPPPVAGGPLRVYRIHTQMLESGGTPACTSVAFCGACSGQCDARGVPVVADRETGAPDMTASEDVLVGPLGPAFGTATFYLPAQVSGDGSTFCPAPTTTVNGNLTAMVGMLTPELLGATTVTFSSTEDPAVLQPLDAGGAFSATVSSAALNAAGGAFSVTLPHGTYDVVVTTGPGSVLASRALSYRTPVGSLVDNLFSVELDPRVLVTGVVTTFAGASVTARVEARPAGEPGAPPDGAFDTLGDGAYMLLLSPGTYDLRVQAQGQAPWVERGVVIAAGDEPTIPLRLMDPSQLVGTVSAFGLGLENAQVKVYIVYPGETVGYELGTTVTTADGYYELLLPNPATDADRACLLVDCS